VGGKDVCGFMASAVARAYMGVWGLCPPVGSRGKAPGKAVRGLRLPEADDILALWKYICELFLIPFT